MTSSTRVGSRTHGHYADTMSQSAFMTLVTFFTLAGVGFCAFFAAISHDWNLQAWSKGQILIFMIGLFLVALGGTWLYNVSDKPLFSATGYALVAGPFGLMIGPVLGTFAPSHIAKALVITLVTTAVLGILGAMIPEDLNRWAHYAFGALLILLLGQFIVPFLGVGALHLWDWVGLVVFGGLVVFDFNRAMHEERTLDKAIDSAADIFLDILNMFLRVASLLGDD